MKVLIPSALQSYTGSALVDGTGDTLDAVLCDLDGRFPGLRFRIVDEQDRIRLHLRVFVNGRPMFDITAPLPPTEQINFVLALSGG
ncbi:MoaD/ThiS family protein [Sphaerotilus sp.]|uniref:MoaD/ThiS family protein n=1 Tax=Sphaerotilus sp. TaxID=2093942 RepID=UPI00286DB149|nr:MoaD/ThiS family protein [Sphaerotilus sp.]